MKKYIVILALLFTNTAAGTELDKDKFTQSLVDGYTKLLCGSGYLSCINKKSSECIQNVMLATYSCKVDEFFNAVTSTENDAKLRVSKEGGLFGECVSKEFFERIKINNKTLSACQHYIIKVMDKKSDEARKISEELKRKFFDEENDLYIK